MGDSPLQRDVTWSRADIEARKRFVGNEASESQIVSFISEGCDNRDGGLGSLSWGDWAMVGDVALA